MYIYITFAIPPVIANLPPIYIPLDCTQPVKSSMTMTIAIVYYYWKGFPQGYVKLMTNYWTTIYNLFQQNQL